jgi:NAD(P)-dependent dehydrogenase (short-subunit alcohol dehydrogenase family)
MRNIVITGAASGLGRVTAAMFTAGGDQVFACDISVEALRSLEESGAAQLCCAVDVSRREQVQQFFRSVRERAEHIDILINNVGVAGPMACLELIEPDDWAHTLDANLNAAFWTMREVLPSMKLRRDGCILNVSTASVHTCPEGRTPYIASKAGLESLTIAVAREAGPFGIRCNAVRPGFMDNERLKKILMRVAQQSGRSSEDVERDELRFVSMRSKIDMTEVASMLHYLASSAARHVTGQVIAVDGGVQWES